MADKKAWKKTTKIHPVLVGRFVHNLKTIRAKLGITHDTLAARAKISPPYVSMLENGARTPSLDVVEQIAGALGVDPADLLKKERQS